MLILKINLIKLNTNCKLDVKSPNKDWKEKKKGNLWRTPRETAGFLILTMTDILSGQWGSKWKPHEGFQTDPSLDLRLRVNQIVRPCLGWDLMVTSLSSLHSLSCSHESKYTTGWREAGWGCFGLLCWTLKRQAGIDHCMKAEQIGSAWNMLNAQPMHENWNIALVFCNDLWSKLPSRDRSGKLVPNF